jgi:hypothetical protein
LGGSSFFFALASFAGFFITFFLGDNYSGFGLLSSGFPEQKLASMEGFLDGLASDYFSLTFVG